MAKEKQPPPPPTPAAQAAIAAAAAAPAHPKEDEPGPVLPTHSCIRVRNSHDAHVIMEAVRMDLLPLVNRRLTPAQRKELGQNGSVFVWERVEGHPLCIKRWDDSLRWRPGLNINPFEIFEERGDLVNQDRKNAKTRPDRNLGRPKGTSYLRPSRRPDVPIKTNGMTRQVYTADVQAATDLAPRRWHLVCYYRKSELDMVPTIEQDRTLARVRVPAGVYRPVTKNIRSLKNPIPILSIPGETDSVPAPHREIALPMNMAGAAPIMLPIPRVQDFIAHMPGGELMGAGVMGMNANIYAQAANGDVSRLMDEDEDEEMDGEEDEDESDDNHGGYGPRTVKSVSASAPRGPPPPVPNANVNAQGRVSLSFARGEPPLGISPPKGPQGPMPPHVKALNYPAGRS